MTTQHLVAQDQSSFESSIRQFITEDMLFNADGFDYGDDDSLLEAGIVDSLGVMELVTFMDRKYQINVPPEDISPENFDSVKRLAAYIRRRHAGAG